MNAHVYEMASSLSAVTTSLKALHFIKIRYYLLVYSRNQYVWLNTLGWGMNVKKLKFIVFAHHIVGENIHGYLLNKSKHIHDVLKMLWKPSAVFWKLMKVLPQG